MPSITFDDVLCATASRVDYGVSRMLASLGAESVRDGLEALGITTDFILIAGEMRTNVSIVTHDHHIKVNEAGPTISADQRSIGACFDLISP